MPETFTPTLIGIGIPTLRALREGALSKASATDSGAEAVHSLREAGYAGGGAIFEAFEQWLAGAGSDPAGVEAAAAEARAGASDLSVAEFGERAAKFFLAAGWGEVRFAERESEGFAEVGIFDCWESASETDAAMPCCHVTTGMLAAFFGRIAAYPVAVLETECRGSGGARCCFAMGNADVMNYEWERLR